MTMHGNKIEAVGSEYRSETIKNGQKKIKYPDTSLFNPEASVAYAPNGGINALGQFLNGSKEPKEVNGTQGSTAAFVS